VGYFGCNNTKIVQLAERLPERIWVFKTPKGMKGAIQLVGSLLVSDEPRVAINTEYPHVIYYDPFSPESVIYTNSGTQERISEVSGYFQYRFHSAFSANFNGDAVCRLWNRTWSADSKQWSLHGEHVNCWSESRTARKSNPSIRLRTTESDDGCRTVVVPSAQGTPIDCLSSGGSTRFYCRLARYRRRRSST
jgi:hypothetical protein